MAKKIKALHTRRYTPALLHWIYRHPQTGKIVVSCDPLNSEAVHRMGVNLIAAQTVG